MWGAGCALGYCRSEASVDVGRQALGSLLLKRAGLAASTDPAQNPPPRHTGSLYSSSVCGWDLRTQLPSSCLSWIHSHGQRAFMEAWLLPTYP